MNRLESISKKALSYFRNTCGATIVMTAMMMPLILGMTAIGVDMGSWMMNKRDLQTATDAAVIAASWEILNNFSSYAEEIALKEAENNGYTPGNGSTLDIQITDEDVGTVVTVTLSEKAAVLFSRIYSHDGEVYISTTAAAAVVSTPGDHCILSLSETADGAVTVQGNATLDTQDCGMAINSNSPSALDLVGNAEAYMGDVTIVGNYEEGNSTDFTYEDLDTNAPAAVDPYADLVIEDYSFLDCEATTSFNSDADLLPGRYCGGLSLGGPGNYNLAPGTYIIDGGDFRVTGNTGSVIGDGGVTIILTSSTDPNLIGNFDIQGGKNIYLVAPAEGEPYEGIVMYQDRDAPSCNNANCINNISGSSGIVLQGAAYFPSRSVTFGGDADAAALASGEICTRLIASTITFTGNPSMGNNCDDVAVRDIEILTVQLIL